MTGDFTEKDRRQMEGLGLSEEEVRRQLALFESPPPPVRLTRAATLGDGILRVGEARREALVARFDHAMESGSISKMVPASGAATRMFRSLDRWLEASAAGPDAGGSSDADLSDEVETLVRRLGDFAFAEELARTAEDAGLDLRELRTRALQGPRSAQAARTLLELLLTGRGLGYSDLPKGLIPFHRYPEPRRDRTPFEEHLVEAARHACDAEGRCRLHFTVPPEHEARFEKLLATRGRGLEQRLGVHFEVAFSHQEHATDTIAVTPENELFRQDDGSLLFRPGGHGALIENLDALARAGADVVFVKNIDNVVPEHRQDTVVLWKKLLGGTLLELRERSRELLRRLEAQGNGRDPGLLDEAEAFVADALSRPLPVTRSGSRSDLSSADRRRALLHRLDRPLRVCGMVRNEGEPGGGPFWVRSREDGELSLQIVEMSQIDTGDPEQREIVGTATHFNPVDLACSVRDHRGAPYDLHDFIDQGTVFIAEKSHQGRPLKALERPGLWNGAMAGWNTVFVEVPLATFAPVKTVLDLLRPEHQGPQAHAVA